MKTIKNDQTLVDMKGEPLKNESLEDVKLGYVLSNIMGGKTDNPALAWILGKKFATQESVDLKAEEVVFVKQEVTKLATNAGSWLSGILGGQILEILDSKDAAEAKG